MAGNRKVKNTHPKEYNGVLYRSTLEAKAAKYLTESGISFRYEPFKITLLPSMKYNGKTIRAVTYCPDFVCNNYIIEVKGWKTDRWIIKQKLIISMILRGDIPYEFREVHTIMELKQVINEIRNERA